MFFKIILLFFLSFLSVSGYAQPAGLPQIKVAALANGTVNWELQYIKGQQLDRKNGFELVVTQVASMSASRLALAGGTVDTIVSDWLWANERNRQGEGLRFLPFSRQIGVLIKADGSLIADFKDLIGKRIGVAGGPMNKGWVLLQASAKAEGIDLHKEATVQFAAPPLLSQGLRKKQIDLLVTFWHFGAKLEAEGFERYGRLSDLMAKLGLKSDLPMLGYLFKQPFIDADPERIRGFAIAVSEAKKQLQESDRPWKKLRPLMRVSNDQEFKALVKGYRQGVPSPLTPHHIEDAQRFYRLIDQLKTYPTGHTLDESLFIRLPL
ncbi:ABC transporter substrate-binding protein [uncultured Neptuniibacter sp.]|uniref:ABC transporter substrate-binding protein n=1 Tax=uncultured Neptuniibacter sp. TaxID=502143 RepID=UPI002626FE3D|nr:ABC transporter substrate-binding protein [uncultured Neptuniibacter sp.]